MPEHIQECLPGVPISQAILPPSTYSAEAVCLLIDTSLTDSAASSDDEQSSSSEYDLSDPEAGMIRNEAEETSGNVCTDGDCGYSREQDVEDSTPTDDLEADIGTSHKCDEMQSGGQDIDYSRPTNEYERAYRVRVRSAGEPEHDREQSQGRGRGESRGHGRGESRGRGRGESRGRGRGKNHEDVAEAAVNHEDMAEDMVGASHKEEDQEVQMILIRKGLSLRIS